MRCRAEVIASLLLGSATVVAVACQNKTGGESSRTNTASVDARSSDVRAVVEDVNASVANMGAVPAWQVVVDRARYLERRGERGVVHGVLGAVTPPELRWLIDDSEGNGALAIRVAMPKTATVAEGDRVAVAGAWSLDDARTWLWRATTVTVLPAAAASRVKDPPAPPGHTIRDDALPPDARPISAAKEAERAYFSVVGDPPVLDGEGWLVGDTPKGRPYALLNMVGERTSYGGQDLRSLGERWQLKRGETYWVRIGPVHRRSSSKLAIINARTAPVRVPLPPGRK